MISPEVSADHKITFRLQAPNAKAVQVAGDFSGETFDLKKDDKGVWSYTTDALKPSSYQYWFIMDGLTMPDPLNTYVRPASGVYKSQVEVPGEETKFMAFRDVPHGVLNEHLYINKENGTARRVVIYTPPGYGSSDKPYPVLYLLHGANDFERGWTQTGRANLIMDNLIADGKVVPAIMVMPFGHEISGATGKLPEVRAVQEMLGVTPVAGVPGIRGGGPAVGRWRRTCSWSPCRKRTRRCWRPWRSIWRRGLHGTRSTWKCHSPGGKRISRDQGCETSRHRGIFHGRRTLFNDWTESSGAFLLRWHLQRRAQEKTPSARPWPIRRKPIKTTN